MPCAEGCYSTPLTPPRPGGSAQVFDGTIDGTGWRAWGRIDEGQIDEGRRRRRRDESTTAFYSALPWARFLLFFGPDGRFFVLSCCMPGVHVSV